jgi:hypothetical protein
MSGHFQVYEDYSFVVEMDQDVFTPALDSDDFLADNYFFETLKKHTALECIFKLVDWIFDGKVRPNLRDGEADSMGLQTIDGSLNFREFWHMLFS